MENLEELKRLIGISYNGDIKFAVNTVDVKSAMEALVEANNQNVGFNRYLELHREYLKDKGLAAREIDIQIDKIKDIKSYFLND